MAELINNPMQLHLETINTLRKVIFKTKAQRKAMNMATAALIKALTPKEELPFIVTEVYVDAPHVKTDHKTLGEVMARINLVREKDFLYSVHVERGGELEYTWENDKKWPK